MIGYLIIDIDPSLEAILLELLLPEGQPQILALSRLNVLRPEAFSPAECTRDVLLYAIQESQRALSFSGQQAPTFVSASDVVSHLFWCRFLSSSSTEGSPCSVPASFGKTIGTGPSVIELSV